MSHDPTIQNLPDHQPPAPTVFLRCEDADASSAISEDGLPVRRCKFVGLMRVRCVIQPDRREREPGAWEAECAQCGLKHDWFGDGS